MAQIELKLSARVQKETGMREVMIRFVQGWKFNARAKSGIFVSPDYFEYFIDRTKTEKAGVKVPNSLITITEANNNYSGNRDKDAPVSNVMLLSFNYTKTARLYAENNPKVQVNYIHGELDKPKSVIFGYGDDLDDTYEKLKNLNDNECLRNMKSIN